MRYVAVLRQSGEGCDYTIACGQKTIVFDAIADDVAHEYVTNQIRENYSHGEVRLEFALLYRVSEELKVDTKTLYREIDDERLAEEAERKLRKAERDLAAAQKQVEQARAGVKR